MVEQDKYSELLQDELFIQWRLLPDEELNEYWNEKISKDPSLSEEILKADNYLKRRHLKKSGITSIEKELLINSINKSIEENIKPRSKIIVMKNWLKYAAMAAIIVSASVIVSQMLQQSPDIAESAQDNIIGNIHEESDIQLVVGDKIISYKQDIDIELSDKGEISIDNEVVNKDNSSNSKVMNKIVVPHGKRSKMRLSDNSVLWLNSGTTVEFPSQFDSYKREIILTKGECFLEVTTDSSRPFYVQTNKMKVKVHGTSFNVSAYENEHQNVVLIEGSVSIETKNNATPIYIEPNEQALIEDNNTITKRKVDTELFTSWRDGYFLFQNTPMTEVLKHLERYYNLSFDYDNSKSIANLKCSGKLIMSNKIESVMRSISILTSTDFSIENKTITITN